MHVFSRVPMPPLLLEVLMTASISRDDRSPFSTTEGSRVTVKIPYEEGKEQVPVGPLLIKDGEREGLNIRCKAPAHASEKFRVGIHGSGSRL